MAPLRPYRVAAHAMALLLLSALLPGLAAAPLTPQEEIGKRIFLEGESPGGQPFYARIGRDLIRVPASAVPCGNCHGPDGLGRPEGGVEPPDITWGNLTKPYGHRHSDGRSHPPFDENAVASAIRARVDPAFNGLNPAMPQYDIPDDDMAALIAYIKRLEGNLGPGVNEATIRIGTLAPGTGNMKAFGDAITATLEAHFAEINVAGGIYGRKIEIAVAERAAGLDETLSNVERLLDEEPVFAFVAGFEAGMERGIFELLDRRGVPNIGPITLLPVPPDYADGGAFLMVGGIAEQMRALVAYAAKKVDFKPSSVTLIHANLADIEPVADTIRREGAKYDWAAPWVVSIADGPAVIEQLVGELARAEAGAVFYIGPDDGLQAFARRAAQTSWRPLILLSGPLNGRAAIDLPPVFDGKVFLAYPNLPSDQTATGIENLRRLRDDRGFGRGHLATRISVLAAAKVLVEGLRRTGKTLVQEEFVRSLERISRFDTGLVPPISFGTSLHVGVSGAHVIGLDLGRRAFAPSATWVALD